jgi:hypothetical protein
MVTRKQLDTAEAVSAAVRIDKDEPTMAYMNFRLSSGDHLDIGMGRHVLERILAQAKESHRRSAASRSEALKRLFGYFPEQIIQGLRRETLAIWSWTCTLLQWWL